MNRFFERLLKAAKKYTVLDYVFFKLTLVSFGLLLGIYFREFFSGYAYVLWLIFFVSYAWIAYRTFVKHMTR